QPDDLAAPHGDDVERGLVLRSRLERYRGPHDERRQGIRIERAPRRRRAGASEAKHEARDPCESTNRRGTRSSGASDRRACARPADEDSTARAKASRKRPRSSGSARRVLRNAALISTCKNLPPFLRTRAPCTFVVAPRSGVSSGNRSTRPGTTEESSSRARV